MLFLISLLASFITVWLLLKYEGKHVHFSGDYDTDSVQKVHNKSVPRIGGIAIFMGIVFGLLSNYTTTVSFLLLALLPVFMIGLWEDLTKKIPPNIRLLAAFGSAAIVVYGLDIELTRIGWHWFDENVLSRPIISMLLTVFMIGGVTHASNIIDGFNGLLLGHSLLALSVFLWVAFQVNDGLVINIIWIFLGSILGLFAFNFPKGKIFTGDGGAYLMGFLLAIIALLLVKNNQEVSPWLPLLVLIYPIFETVFSIYRKKILQGESPNLADSLHLHILLYKRLVKHRFLFLTNIIGNNGATSVLIWLLVLPFMLPALFWWHSHWVMIISMILFCIVYTLLYWTIVRFGFKK